MFPGLCEHLTSDVLNKGVWAVTAGRGEEGREGRVTGTVKGSGEQRKEGKVREKGGGGNGREEGGRKRVNDGRGRVGPIHILVQNVCPLHPGITYTSDSTIYTLSRLASTVMSGNREYFRVSHLTVHQPRRATAKVTPNVLHALHVTHSLYVFPAPQGRDDSQRESTGRMEGQLLEKPWQ